MPIAAVIVYQKISVAEMTTRKMRTDFSKDVAVDHLLQYIRYCSISLEHNATVIADDYYSRYYYC